MRKSRTYQHDTVVVPTSILVPLDEVQEEVYMTRDHLYLNARQYIKLSTAPTDTNAVGTYTFLGPEGHKLCTTMPSSAAPIRCLVDGHTAKTKWRAGDIAASFNPYETGWVHYWMRKYGQVECKACGALLRERQYEEDPISWKWKYAWRKLRGRPMEQPPSLHEGSTGVKGSEGQVYKGEIALTTKSRGLWRKR